MPLVAPGIFYPDPYWHPPGRVVGGSMSNNPWTGSSQFGGIPAAPQPQVLQTSTGNTFNGRTFNNGFGPGVGRGGVPPLATSATTGRIQAGVINVPR